MADSEPRDVAFDLEFQAAVQDWIARATTEDEIKVQAFAKAARFRVEAGLAAQVVPLTKVRRPTAA